MLKQLSKNSVRNKCKRADPHLLISIEVFLPTWVYLSSYPRHETAEAVLLQYVTLSRDDRKCADLFDTRIHSGDTVILSGARNNRFCT